MVEVEEEEGVEGVEEVESGAPPPLVDEWRVS